ncbi:MULTISPECIES: transglycosylase domain-containing protein [unclassified Janthinobacterium]|uniref:transglycosylase domain-containing protein n=1 Tax=unclassified Janthinobacterium TaxID=2610881 RepID=UPI001617456D|nr:MULTISPECIES: transglycosylase domain-containing protein [unclassified Janthinobacterium]MBB5370935.1 membrane peptidoglycan carboxypeptidase [Janthinobacterium sp. K2C7]MBB5383741.1 membrane peptidoglycan carboxypeptidase [Janthinobacterium sp. K2Li3]MBB5388246.1 membrane peptidoglycan carboxypeptidase [Janthinobacterium sp. K2E3]
MKDTGVHLAHAQARPNSEPESGPDAPPPAGPQKRRRSRIWPIFLILLLALIAGVAWFVLREVRTSALQAEFFNRLSRQLTYKVEAGPAPEGTVRYPQHGPYDERLGYASLPDYLSKLNARDYAVTAQARMSAKMVQLADMGVFATYHEKNRAGLTILDCRAQPLFAASYPERMFNGFDEAPPALVQSLLFIENRELLDPGTPQRNPAVEWDRLSKAILDKALNLFGGHRGGGGSTLATQIEKYRHSEDGRTSSMKDKLFQMMSASLRSYQDGENTVAARRKIVVNYLNTVPLSAKSGFGEVNGIGDGMWVWYGRPFDEVKTLLNGKLDQPGSALAYKEALSLLIAQRRPSHYLVAGGADLEALTNSHLRLLAQAGVISPQLRDAAIAQPLHPSMASGVQSEAATSFVTRKASNAVRNHLASMLGDPRLYNLDRLDLNVVSTLDAQAQNAVTKVLRELRDPEAAKAAGLTGKGMLGNGDPANVVYSFTLLQKGDKANLLRVQTDNYDQPLDINEGAKLDLGSTAKLRTLVTYLDIMDQLQQRYSGMSAAELNKVAVDPKDLLSQWAIAYFKPLPLGEARNLPAMLAAAMERKYSGSPNEGFFTGGGLHHFGNFSKLDDSRILTVQQALRQSTNLVFVRLMRDVARYYMFSRPDSSASLLADADDPRRAQYLSRFADKEGREFLHRFYQKYRGKSVDEQEKVLLASIRPTPVRLANIYRTINPQGTLAEFSDFLGANLPSQNEVPPERVAKMYQQYAMENWSLADRGYLANVHPLELWMVAYLRQHEGSTLAQMVAASEKERQQVYKWLFNTHRKHAQDRRIANLLEVEGFLEIHRQWKKMGYPFDSLVPSYATTLGASADRPAALAELMGIIINDGVRKPSVRIDSMHFAADTPYDTLVKRDAKAKAEQVLSPDVARAVAKAIREVVSDGTAKRAKTAFIGTDGQPIPMGGKTGTGDQRFDVYGAGGRLIESRYVNRSATFVFNIGERFYGSMTAYVRGPESKNYDFTSALPVQLLVSLAPSLMPLIEPPAQKDAVLKQCGN